MQLCVFTQVDCFRLGMAETAHALAVEPMNREVGVPPGPTQEVRCANVWGVSSCTFWPCGCCVFFLWDYGIPVDFQWPVRN